LRDLVDRGGDSANMAIQLVILETLQDLRSGPSSSNPKNERLTLEDLRAGGGDEESGDVVEMLGAQGPACLPRLSAAMDPEPETWNQRSDGKAAEALGSDLMGLQRSMQKYGKPELRFGSQELLEKMRTMLAALHGRHRRGHHHLIGTNVGQSLKAMERDAGDNRLWEVAWFPVCPLDPGPSKKMKMGLTPPAGAAASAATLTEMPVPDDFRKRIATESKTEP
jgi:hypothetical protein